MPDRDDHRIESAAELTVDQLMERIRARIAEKRARGGYPEEEQTRSLPKSYQDLDQAIQKHLAQLNALWDPTEPHPIVSHRPVLGRFIVLGKRLLRRLLRPLVNVFLARQKEFDAHTVRLLNPTLIILRDLTLRFEELATMYYTLQKRHCKLWEDYQELRYRLDHLNGKVQDATAGIGLLRVDETPPETGGLDTQAYVDFEKRHRGTRKEILDRQRVYLEDFRECGGPVLDLGCGRGEFLELLAEAGLEGEGVDLNPGMVKECTDRGFRAVCADALAHLKQKPEASLGGVFAAQLIEHLPFGAVASLVEAAYRALRPGGILVLETLNPLCLSIFSGPFYLDPTHVRPLHPEAMRFLLEHLGFRDVRLRFLSPVPEEAKLKSVDFFHRLERFEDALLNVLNDNFARLNALLYGHQEYAVLGRK